MSKHKEITESKLKQIQQIIDNTANDNSILKELEEFGFNDKKLHEGKLLYNKAYELFQSNFIAHKLDYPDNFQSLWQKAFQYYLQLIHISRVALQSERQIFIQLGLAGPRKSSLSGWLSQANQYYINALSNPELCKKLEDFGISKNKLKKGKNLLDKVEVATIECCRGNGDIKKLSLEFDNAIDNIECWLYRFNTVSRIVLEKNPTLLKKLQTHKK